MPRANRIDLARGIGRERPRAVRTFGVQSRPRREDGQFSAVSALCLPLRFYAPRITEGVLPAKRGDEAQTARKLLTTRQAVLPVP